MKACDSFTSEDAYVVTMRTPATEEERGEDEDGNGNLESEEDAGEEGE